MNTVEKGKHTPGPWRVRYHPTYPHPNDFHVSAPTAKGHPYFGATEECEILSDEDYPLKEADARFIVRAVNAHTKAFELLQKCRNITALPLEVRNEIDEWLEAVR